MKLAAYRRDGEVRVGSIAGDEIIDMAADMAAFLASDDKMAPWQGAIRFPLSEVELLAPVLRPGKVMGMGHNYGAISVIGHQAPIALPRTGRQVGYAGKLAVVIGRRGRNISERDAFDYIGGYTCATVVDAFCPLGPVLVTPNEIPDPGHLRLRTRLNGMVVQDECTSDIRSLISYVSSLSTLEPGDVILTGTAAGIGSLQPGDLVEVEIDGIGTLSNPVAAEA